MKISFIGTGNMGRALATRLAGTADLTLAGRDRGAAVAAFTDTLDGVVAAGIDEAIGSADIVVLAVPYDAALELAGNAALDGKIVVDMSNPVAPDFSGLTLGHTSSAGEEIARRAGGARRQGVQHEPLGMLNIRLGYGLGRGTEMAPGWMALAA